MADLEKRAGVGHYGRRSVLSELTATAWVRARLHESIDGRVSMEDLKQDAKDWGLPFPYEGVIGRAVRQVFPNAVKKRLGRSKVTHYVGVALDDD